MSKLSIMGVIVLAIAGTGVAGPVTMFSDDFNSETAGLNRVPSQWTVSGGTVDIIGDGTSWDWLPAGNGLYMDLDGTRGDPGLMTTKVSFDLLPGFTYTLTFELAGNQGAGSPNTASAYDTVRVTIGGMEWDFEVAKMQPMTTYILSGTVAAAITSPLTFQNITNADDQGALLDNVLLTSRTLVPAPGAILLGGLGVGLVGWLRRRHAL